MSSFFFPHAADNVMSAVDRGLLFDEGTGFSTQFQDAGALLQENFAALEDYTASQSSVTLTATLDGAGAATVAHGIGQPFGLLLVQAWCKGATATDFAPVSVAAVDDTNVTLTAGTAGAAVRVYLVFSIVPPGW